MLYQELTVAAGQGAPEDVAANLRLYLTRFKPLPNDDDLASLAAVLCGACPEVTPVHAIRMLEDSGGLLSRRLLNCTPRPRAEGPGRAGSDDRRGGNRSGGTVRYGWWPDH